MEFFIVPTIYCYFLLIIQILSLIGVAYLVRSDYRFEQEQIEEQINNIKQKQ